MCHGRCSAAVGNLCRLRAIYSYLGAALEGTNGNRWAEDRIRLHAFHGYPRKPWILAGVDIFSGGSVNGLFCQQCPCNGASVINMSWDTGVGQSFFVVATIGLEGAASNHGAADRFAAQRAQQA